MKLNLDIYQLNKRVVYEAILFRAANNPDKKPREILKGLKDLIDFVELPLKECERAFDEAARAIRNAPIAAVRVDQRSAREIADEKQRIAEMKDHARRVAAATGEIRDEDGVLIRAAAPLQLIDLTGYGKTGIDLDTPITKKRARKR